MAMPKKKKPGRPKLAPEERKNSRKFSIHMPADLEAKLKAVAVKRGGNRNAEIIERLEASFSFIDDVDFGPPHIFSLCRFLGILIRNYEAFDGEQIWNDPAYHDELKDAVVTVLDAFGPEGGVPTRSLEETSGQMRGISRLTQLVQNKELPFREKDERLAINGEYVEYTQDQKAYSEIAEGLGFLFEKLEAKK